MTLLAITVILGSTHFTLIEHLTLLPNQQVTDRLSGYQQPFWMQNMLLVLLANSISKALQELQML